MSTDRARRRKRRNSTAGVEASAADERSSIMLEADDATRIARGLTEKYGSDALAFAADRARIAVEVGDDLALDAWRAVIDATRALLRRLADA